MDIRGWYGVWLTQRVCHFLSVTGFSAHLSFSFLLHFGYVLILAHNHILKSVKRRDRTNSPRCNFFLLLFNSFRRQRRHTTPTLGKRLARNTARPHRTGRHYLHHLLLYIQIYGESGRVGFGAVMSTFFLLLVPWENRIHTAALLLFFLQLTLGLHLRILTTLSLRNHIACLERPAFQQRTTLPW